MTFYTRLRETLIVRNFTIENVERILQKYPRRRVDTYIRIDSHFYVNINMLCQWDLSLFIRVFMQKAGNGRIVSVSARLVFENT
jgi:hypothetical protein